MSDGVSELLLEVQQVKYRNNNAGKSPVGSLRVFREHVEWKDSSTEEISKFPFVQIKGQRVSPPNKSKVQLQLCLHSDEQATFVFLSPSLDKDGLIKERDLVKETLQQALIAHRARVAQLAAKSETCSKTAELEAKKKLLLENQHLEQLYKHLVSTKLISPQEFWTDYYKNNGIVEEQVGVSGGFLANIAQCEGANGVKLNLNTEIIQAIFNTYPVVERKHLELVPHEMTEKEFWSKFFQSHYFHREREVLPNPNDPFADCVKKDEEEIQNLVNDGVKRKRFDFDYLSDNAMDDMNKRPEPLKMASKTMLVRRCNYLSERILGSLSANSDLVNPDAETQQGGTSQNGPLMNGTNGLSNGSGPSGSGTRFGALQRPMDEVESRLESADLADDGVVVEVLPVKFAAEKRHATEKTEDTSRFTSLVQSFLDSRTDEDILGDATWIDEMTDESTDEPIDITENGLSNGLDNGMEDGRVAAAPISWGLPPQDMVEVTAIHESVSELLKHFWMCIPPNTPELETKLSRMSETISKYKLDQLAHAAQKFGVVNFEHCFRMIDRAEARYQQFMARKKK